MSKINLTDATTLTNETSFISTLNTNFAIIETESDNFLSLDGTSPNSMSADLDMDSNRILNLPTPVSSTEPLRLQDLSDFTGGGTITAGAPVTASYVTLGTNSTLTAERVLTAGSNITLTDAGAGSTLTVALTSPVSTVALVSPTVTTKISPTTNDGAPLGDTTHQFSDLFLATGGVVNWNNGGVTITETSDFLTFAGASVGYYFDAITAPSTNDGAPLGTTSSSWSDLFLASGAVVNWNAGDVTLTHSANLLAFAGASSGYTFDAVIKPSANDAAALGASGTAWSDLFVASGAVLNFNAGDVTLTHSSGTLTSNAVWSQTGAMSILTGTGVPAGGTAGAGYKFSNNSALGIYFGSSTPTLSAAHGSLYIRTDGSSSSTRLYVNSNDSTGWIAMTSAS